MEDNWWRRRSKLFRLWAFSTGLWILLVFLFVVLVNPEGLGRGFMRQLQDLEFGHYVKKVLFYMMVPPGLAAAAWFGYHRFVK